MTKLFQVLALSFFMLTSFRADAQYFKPAWVNDIGGTGDSKATNIVADNSGDIYISGYIRGTVTFNLKEGGTKTLTSNGDADIYIAKYNMAAGNYEWAISMGGPGLEQPNSMTVDAQGNVLIIGQFQSSVNFNPSGNFTLTSNGSDDIFIAKYTSGGNFVWATSIGGGDIDRGHYIVTDNQSNVFITASYTGAIDADPSAGTTMLPNQGSLAGFFAKYDANGNFVWAHPLGVLVQPSLINLTVDKTTNDVIVDGDFSGSVDFSYTGNAAATFNSAAQANFIARYTNNGVYEWVRYLPGSGSGILSSVKVDNQSNIIVTGSFGGQFYDNGPAGTALTASGASDVLVASYKSNGALNWGENFGSSTSAAASRYVTVDANNNIYITGYFTGTVNISSSLSDGVLSNNAGGRSILIAGFNSSGTPIAAGAIGGACSSNLGYEIAAVNGNVFVAGSFCGTEDFDTSSCNVDNFTAVNGISDSFLASFSIANTTPITNNILTAPAVNTFCGPGDPAAITASTPTGGAAPYSYQWQSSADGINFTDISGATAQTYDPAVINASTSYRRIVTGTCGKPDTSSAISIQVQPALANNVVTAPAVTTFCSTGDPAVINGNTPAGGSGTYSYQWQSSPDNTTFTDIQGATSVNYDPTVINANTYYRRVVTSGSCTSPFASNAVEMVITQDPQTPAFSNAPLNACAGNSATINIASPQQGVTYQWYDTSAKTNLLFTGTSFTTPVLNANTTYYVNAVNGICSSPALGTVTVNVSNIPAAPAVANNTVAVCSGTSATLSISGPQAGFTYNWYTAATGGAAVFTGADFITPGIASNTIYYAEAVNGTGCTSVRTAVNVNANPQPPISTQGASVCPGTTATLTATSTDANVSINWYTSASGGSAVFTGASFTTPALNGNITYYAEATDNATGCVSTSRTAARVQILQPLPAPNVTVASTTTSSVTFQWNAVQGATGYQVSTDGGQTFTDPSSGSNGLTHTVSGLQTLQTVTIIVRSLGGSGCQLSANSAAVTGTAASPLGDQIFVPNAFTPNGDGKNDIVYVRSTNIQSLKFYIYDQWGELIYTSVNQANGWDGTYKGSKEPAGVYVYYLEAIMNDGKQLSKKGSITLLR